MDITEIEAFIQQCTPKQLRTLEKLIADQIKVLQAQSVTMDDETARQLRAESRFDLEMHGSLRRLTDVRPNQRTEYAVMIRDVSRSGMCLHVSSGFVASRAVEVTFQGPGRKMKTVQLEVVRMKRVQISDRKYLEIGCRSITGQELAEIMKEEQKTKLIQEKMENRDEISVFVISPRTNEVRPIVDQIKKEGYHVRALNNLQMLKTNLQHKSIQAAVLLDGSRILTNPQDLKSLMNISSQIALLAIIDDDEQRCQLLKIGVDECVLDTQVNKLLFRSLERALVGHTLRKNQIDPDAKCALIVSANRVAVNMLSYHLEEAGLKIDIAANYDEINPEKLNKYVIVLADFKPDDAEPFTVLHSQIGDTPLVAICEKITYGTDAMTHQAADYVNLPLNQNQIQVMLQALVPGALVPF